MENSKESVCDICGKVRELHHATTWGVAGALLGCNTYYLCAACSVPGNHRPSQSTLSPCAVKHTKTFGK